ncbi:MAG: oligosaccharide flippase family protein [Pseudomonadaceae bacterium]|nr:oligosaccharide flippase family protein [Pseudomonadaceae bacterium]
MQFVNKVSIRLRTFFGGESLSARARSGGTILLLAEFYSNGLRLLSNLVMTRLLYPEAFGLMLIVNLVFSALGMLSDVGIRSAIISRKADVDEKFLNVAWTISIVRGFCLCLIAVCIAKPVAILYGSNELFGLILLAAVAPAVQGFTSPIPLLYEKKLQFFRVAIFRAAAQSLALIVTLIWLFISPSIWALAAHGIFGALFLVGFSFLLFSSGKIWWEWDRTIAKELFHFGKWVLLATALTFMGRQGDSLIVSRFLSIEMLGVFSIAITFAKLIEMVVEKLSWGLLFPLFSEVKSDQPDVFHRRLLKLRLAMYSLCFPLVVFLATLGRDVISILYDARYHQAGWMLEVLALGFGFYILTSAVNSIPLAHEDSKRHMWLQFLRVASILVSMLVGGVWFGTTGLIWGIAAGQALYYPLLQYAIRDFGIRPGYLDLVFAGGTVALVALTWGIRGIPSPV